MLFLLCTNINNVNPWLVPFNSCPGLQPNHDHCSLAIAAFQVFFLSVQPIRSGEKKHQTIPRIGSEQMVPTIQCLLKSFLTQDVFLDKYIFKQSVKVKHDFQTFGIHINVRTFNFYAENFINHRKATSLKPVLSTGCLTPTHWCGIKTTSNIWKNFPGSTFKESFQI